jgi:hypothetical protein
MRTHPSAALLNLAILLLGSGGPNWANAAIVKSYVAGSQPTAPAPNSAEGGSWTAGGTASTNVVETTGQEGGVNHWSIVDDNVTTAGATANESRAYSMTAASVPALTSAFADPAGWTMTVVLKVLSASNNPSGVAVDVRGGGKLFNLTFVNNGTLEVIGQSVQGNTAVGANSGAVTAIPNIASVDLDGQYNTIQLWFDPSDQLADVYVNGVFKASMTGGSSGATQVLWSSNTSAATSDTRWRFVQFETGKAIVPEPTCGAVWLALAALACGAKIRRRSGRA